MRCTTPSATRARRHRRFVLLVGVLLVTTAACGQTSGSDGSGAPDAAPEPALEGMLDGLEVDYGCGHGFYASNADQTRGLFIFAADPASSTEELGVPGQVELPDDDWDAHVETGEHLFANWCDDVIGPDEPEAVTEARYDITGGTMTVVQDDPNVFTARLHDVEAALSDGTVVDLGDVTTTNELWGLYAG